MYHPLRLREARPRREQYPAPELCSCPTCVGWARHVTDSPLELFLQAFDRLDADACAALFANQGRLRYVDGRVDEGPEAVRDRLREYFADLSSTTHTLREHWHQDRVWVGELEASYVLADDSILGPVSKVFIVRMAHNGIEELRVYAAVEPAFHETRIRHERERDQGMMVGGRWVPPL
jgi:hypothetical protein